MIRLCKNLFYKPKYGSDADSIILRHLFSTVAVVLVCLAAISFSAYAFFSYSVTSGSNIIQASNFSTTVTIKARNDSIITQGNIQTHTFDSGQYTVTIAVGDGITGTGFGIVNMNGTTYYTQQLGKDMNAPDQVRTEVSFVLDVQATATIAFASRWGTTSYYNSAVESNLYIQNTDPLTVITVDGTQGIADNPEDTTPEQTTPKETTPAETTPEETTPAETTPEETTPEETTPEETTPEETTPEETTPEETTPAETNPEETTPEETTPEETTPEETIPEETIPEVTVPTTDPAEIIHIVQPNESLASIAEKCGTTYPILAAYNKLDDPRVIQPGQEIRIPTEQTE